MDVAVDDQRRERDRKELREVVEELKESLRRWVAIYDYRVLTRAQSLAPSDYAKTQEVLCSFRRETLMQTAYQIEKSSFVPLLFRRTKVWTRRLRECSFYFSDFRGD